MKTIKKDANEYFKYLRQFYIALAKKRKKPVRKLGRKQRKQLALFTVILLIASIVAIMLLTPVFDITEIRVYGHTVIKTEDIIAHSKISKGVNIFDVNLSNAKDNILSIIVSVAEMAFFDQHIGAGVHIDTVIAYIHAVGGYVTDRYVGAEQGMDHPQRRIDQRNAFQQNAAAFPELKHGRAQETAFTENSPVNRDSFKFKSVGTGTGRCLKGLKCPPLFSAAAENAFPCNGAVGQFIAVDHRGIIDDLHTAPAGVNGGQEQFRIGGKFDETSLFKVQFNPALHPDGAAAAEKACRQNDPAAP